MSSPNLGIIHIAAAQNQPEVTANDAFDALDDSINLEASIALADANTTLTQAQLASGGALKFTGALTANRTLSLPASIGRLFMALNATTGGYSLVIEVTGAPGTTVTVTAALGLVLLYSDGTNVIQLSGSGSSLLNFSNAEVPGGSINGSNAAFTLAHAPTSGSLMLVQRLAGSTAGGAVLIATVDYTLSGANITMTNPPASGDTLYAWYRY